MKRRIFLNKTTQAGLGFCSIMLTSNVCSLASTNKKDKIVPAKLNYCGYQCPENCPFLKGSLENDVELKKEAYTQWKIKERFHVDFYPEKIFCYGCKTKDKPEGIVLVNCTVRSCAMEKELECCIECDELVTCRKDLWSRFPDFKKQVIKMQEEYKKT
jgi:hypothetical protein